MKTLSSSCLRARSRANPARCRARARTSSATRSKIPGELLAPKVKAASTRYLPPNLMN